MIYYFKSGNNALRFDKDSGLINEITMEELPTNNGGFTLVKNLRTYTKDWVIPADYVDATHNDWIAALSKIRNFVTSIV